jgi:hypothetical protein
METDKKFQNLFSTKAKDIVNKKRLEHMTVNVFKNERLSLGITSGFNLSYRSNRCRSDVCKSILIYSFDVQEYGEEAKKYDAKILKVGVEKKDDEIRPEKMV